MKLKPSTIKDETSSPGKDSDLMVDGDKLFDQENSKTTTASPVNTVNTVTQPFATSSSSEESSLDDMDIEAGSEGKVDTQSPSTTTQKTLRKTTICIILLSE